MKRIRLRIIMAVLVPIVFGVLHCLLSETLADAPEDSTWRDCKRKMHYAAARGDFDLAESIARELCAHCREVVGDLHPDTTVSAASARAYHQLQRLDGPTKDQYVLAAMRLHACWGKIDEIASNTFPTEHLVRTQLIICRKCIRPRLPNIPPEGSLEVDGDGYIVRVLCLARMFEQAEPYALSGHAQVCTIAGQQYARRAFEIMLASILIELGKEPAKQIALLEDNIEFADRYETTVRLEFWKERAMTLLAESHYRLGNRREANQLYAEVRSRLPEDSNNSLAGWCRSWCDRHEARQLIEKGDWDGAYDKILQARVGTIKYGHRNLSKGLTMERILRMSAEIQRKRGNDKEADDDLEYAESIANHAAKLRKALEAELKAFDLTGDQGGPAAEGTTVRSAGGPGHQK